jgi:3-dehydroquinate synthase
MHGTYDGSVESARITVSSTAGSYAVVIAQGLIARLGALLDATGLGGRARFVVSNPLVWKLYGQEIEASLPEAQVLLMPDGERYKHLQTVGRLYEGLMKGNADRSAVVVALGGGVVGDTAGFAAATYLRGVPLVQVPTTLLAQVDSAIGGKVGVNHAFGKNLIGSFYPPVVVAVDPRTLGSLQRREFRAGLYEVVKYAVMASRSLFERLQQDLKRLFAREPDALTPVIVECCQLKAAIVSGDEREAGNRRLLNLGHTTAHALEAITKYRRFRHGEAVAYGLMAAADIAATRGVLPEEDRAALLALIAQLGPLPAIADLSIAEALQAMRRDKKVVSGRLHFVLPSAIGSAHVVKDVSEKELRATLKKLGLQD